MGTWVLQALSQQKYIMTNGGRYIYSIAGVTGNHNSFGPVTVIPKRGRAGTVLRGHTHTYRHTYMCV